MTVSLDFRFFLILALLGFIGMKAEVGVSVGIVVKATESAIMQTEG